MFKTLKNNIQFYDNTLLKKSVILLKILIFCLCILGDFTTTWLAGSITTVECSSSWCWQGMISAWTSVLFHMLLFHDVPYWKNFSASTFSQLCQPFAKSFTYISCLPAKLIFHMFTFKIHWVHDRVFARFNKYWLL